MNDKYLSELSIEPLSMDELDATQQKKAQEIMDCTQAGEQSGLWAAKHVAKSARMK